MGYASDTPTLSQGVLDLLIPYASAIAIDRSFKSIDVTLFACVWLRIQDELSDDDLTRHMEYARRVLAIEEAPATQICSKDAQSLHQRLDDLLLNQEFTNLVDYLNMNMQDR